MSVSVAEIRSQVGDLSRWAVHLDNPLSDEALADPQKPYITVGDFSFPDSMCPHDAEDTDLDVFEQFAKQPNESGLVSNCKSDICTRREETGDCQARDLTSPLHVGFQKAARYILGESVYTSAAVILTYKRLSVAVGTGNETEWHVDSGDDLPPSNRCLMGLLSSALTTQILLNPTCRKDYENGYLRRIMSVPIDEVNLQVVTLPPGKLAVVPMSLPHRGQVATVDIERRDFMRWWVDK